MASAYDLIDADFMAKMDVVRQRREQAEKNKLESETQLQDQYTQTGRGLNISYQKEINPFGQNAERRAILGSGVSDYYRNAAYGSLLQGLGKATQNYNTSLLGVRGDYENLMSDYAAQEADIQTDKTTKLLNQQQIDEERRRWDIQQVEERRRWDIEQALAMAKLGGKSTGSPSGTPITDPNTGVENLQLAGIGGGGVSAFGSTNTSRAVSTQSAAQKAIKKSVIASRGGLPRRTTTSGSRVQIS